MTVELSSNWKKIQPTLKKVVKDTVKRKIKVAPERQLNAQAKRRRLEGKLVTNYTTPETSRNRNRMKTTETRQIISAGSSVPFQLWAEDNDISAKDLAEAYGGGLRDKSILAIRPDEINGGLSEDVEVGKYVGIDCEMVGVGGIDNRSVLARVSIVNFHGTQVYDSFVKPKEFVTDWRTHISGVSSKNMATARDFEEVQHRVAAILKDRVLVGHAIENDLRVLMLGHPKRDIRDTSRFSGFRKHSGGRTPSLRKLIKEILGMDIQDGVHSSIEDARATMLLFRCHKSAFDVEHAKNFPASKSGAKTSESRPKSKRKKAKKTR